MLADPGASFHTGDKLRVSLEQDTRLRWAYTVTLTDADLTGDTLRLPIVPAADEPYPGERPLNGSRTVVDYLFDVGDPGQALTVVVAAHNPRTDSWAPVAKAPLRWNLDRVSIGALQDEQKARFHDALAASNVWPEPGSQDATARRIAGGLIHKAVGSGDKVLGWSLAGSGWVQIRNRYGVVIEDVWTLNIGFQHGADCFVDEVKLVRPYTGTTPGSVRITGTSAATARPIRCAAIGD